MVKNLMKQKYLWLFTLPALFVYSVFWIVPLIVNIPISFSKWNGLAALTRQDFIGLGNYSRLFQDKVFMLALQNNLVYTVLSAVFTLTLSLAVAFLLDRYVRFKGFFRTVWFFPNILPFIVVSYLWLWIYNPAFGLLNGLLDLLGLDHWVRMWLSDPKIALYSLIATSVWSHFPFYMLIFLAGLQDIPKELEEAAKIDGSNGWRVIWHIVLPHLRPILAIVVTLLIFDGFRVFELIYVMTNGGPGYHSTEVLATLMFKRGLLDLDFGYGSAISIFVTIFVMLIAAANFAFMFRADRRSR